MTEGTLTHKDLSRLLGVSETTIKSYRRKFPDGIPVASQGKPIRFTAQGAEVARRIRDLFELGMSVAEVRLRLSAEFAWISAEAPEGAEGDGGADAAPVTPATAPAVVPAPPVVAPVAQPARVELPQDFTAAISGLARSMVNLTRQQEVVLKRLQHLEEYVASQFTAAQEAHPGRELLEQTLAATERVEATLNKLLEQAEKQPKSEFGMRPLLKVLGGRGRDDKREPEPAPQQPAAPGAHGDAQHHGGEPTPPPLPETLPPADGGRPIMVQEPPRALMGLPLVALSPQGEFLGVAGKARARFSSSDLKAMLSYAFLPPAQYELHWGQNVDGWWLDLVQPSSADPLNLRALMQPMVTPRGNEVLCVTRYWVNGVEGHPTELHAFIRAALG